jgi:hypothetical protein
MAPETSVPQPGDATSTSAPPTSAPAAAQVPLPTVEAEGLQPIYANFVKVGPAPEELVLDFGLNPNLPGSPIVPIKVSQRLVMNYFTAKRLWGALALSLQRHEQAFGVLETDVNKRVVPQGQRPAAR